MSDSASNKTDIPLPKLTRSQIANTEKQPSLGDISAIQSEIKSSKSTSQYVGNTQDVATPSVNDVLGDITLLEEAFAEMEVSVADYEQEIPMLRSTIEQPSSISQVETEAVEASNQSIPVLDQPPTEFVEEPLSSNDSIHIGTNPDLDLSSESNSDIPVLENNTSKVEEPASELTMSSVISIPENADSIPLVQEETADEVINTPDSLSEVDIDQPSSHHSLIESNSEPTVSDIENTEEIENSSTVSEPPSEPSNELPELSVVHTDPSQMEPPENDAIQSEISDKETSEQGLSALIEDSASLISQFSEPNTVNDDEPFPSESTSIEEKIANATGDAEPSAPDPALDNIEEQLSTELAPSVIEDVAPSHISPPGDDVNMSIPFELHAQLSKKIDALVLDATLSLTSELQNQLSLQLESLLCGAVEAVLPRLVDQMVNELRAEVKGRVQQQLPIIVNEVLGKTRLS